MSNRPAFEVPEPRLLLADTLSATLTVDNSFDFYISTDESAQSPFVGHGDNWGQNYQYSADLVSGVTNHIRIVGVDAGGIAGFAGTFTLDGSFSFGNGTQSLGTAEVGEWSVSRSGFAQNYEVPALSNCTWSNSFLNGRAIWTNNGYNTNTMRCFSAPIIPSGPDLVAPVILDVLPLPAEAGSITAAIDQLTVRKSESLRASGVNDPASRGLRAAGSDVAFDTADGVVYAVSANPAYVLRGNVSLAISPGPLQVGQYLLTARAAPEKGRGFANKMATACGCG